MAGSWGGREVKAWWEKWKPVTCKEVLIGGVIECQKLTHQDPDHTHTSERGVAVWRRDEHGIVDIKELELNRDE